VRHGVILASLLLSSSFVAEAELTPATVAAFDRYVRHTEARMESESSDERRFLFVDAMDDTSRRLRLAELRKGGLVIERLETKDAGKEIDIPDGIVHHWVGLVFVPGVTVNRAVELLQAYDRHAEIFKPAVARSAILDRSGDTFRVYLRFYMKKVIAVTLNTEHEATFVRPSPTRAHSRIVSTRIAEVEEPDTPAEREKPVGNDGGYLWRINSYWRFLERDGGVYLQCESISLTRGIPTGFGWLIGPFVTSIPRESLTFTLETARKRLATVG
jgi:hypothetical protein